MAKVGRPIKLFTVEEKKKMEEMAFNQCQDKTIAAVIGVQVDCLKRHFKTVLHKKRCEGKAALRASQAEMAMKGKQPAMAIFLGKNYLEQKDSKDVKVHGDMKIQIVDYAKKSI